MDYFPILKVNMGINSSASVLNRHCRPLKAFMVEIYRNLQSVAKKHPNFDTLGKTKVFHSLI